MIQLLVDGKGLDLDSRAKYRMQLKMPLPGGDLEFSSTSFFDLPYTDHNLEVLNTSKLLAFSGRYRTYPCILRLAGMDLRGTLVVTNYGTSLRSSISFLSFRKDLSRPISELVDGSFSVTPSNLYSIDSYGEGCGAMPTIYNPKAYGDQDEDGGGKNPGYGGLINWYDGASNSYKSNAMPTTEEEFNDGYNANSRAIFPWLLPVLNSVVGCEITGSFVADKDISNLVMYSHAMSDSLYTSEPISHTFYPVNTQDGIVRLGANVQLPFGDTNDGYIYLRKPGMYELTAEFESPNAVFEWSGDPSEFRPDDQPSMTYAAGKSVLSWKGFLEMKSDLGNLYRILRLKKVAGIAYGSAKLTVSYYETWRLNKGASIVQPAHAVLPSLTGAEILTSLCSSFCATVLVDPPTGKVQMELMKDILRSGYLDISDIVGNEIEVEPIKPSKYVFEFDYPNDGYCSGDNFRNVEGRPLIEVRSYFEAPDPTPNAFLLDQATLSVYSAEENEDGDVVWKFFTDMGGKYTYGDSGEEVGISSKCTPMVNQIVTEPSGAKIMVPVCEMEVASKVFGVNNLDIPFRLLHWRGLRSGSNAEKYPFATSGSRDMMGNKVASFELFWGSENGLVNTFWSSWLDYLNSAEVVTLPLLPNEEYIQQLIGLFLPQNGEQVRKVYAANVEMIPTELVLEFTTTAVTGLQLKALRSVTPGQIRAFPPIPAGNPVVVDQPTEGGTVLPVPGRLAIQHVKTFGGFIGAPKKVSVEACYVMPNNESTYETKSFDFPAVNGVLRSDWKGYIDVTYSDIDANDQWFTANGEAWLDYVTVRFTILAGATASANAMSGNANISHASVNVEGSIYEHTFEIQADVEALKGVVIRIAT